jgi:hypothetical protein
MAILVAKRVLLVLALMLSGCSGSGQNLIQLQDSRNRLVGLSDEKILACMGRPQGRFTYGSTEVWQYNSNAAREPAGGAASTPAHGATPMAAGGPAATSAPAAGARYCVVNVAMSNKAVQSVNYSGLSGAAPEAEQCATAVKGCLPQ